MEEILGFILEFILDLFGDVLLQLLFEAVGAAGGLSLFPFPSPLVHPSRRHGISVLVAPAVTGLVMHTLGTIRRRYGGALVRLDTFTYAFLFALGMALVRFQ